MFRSFSKQQQNVPSSSTPPICSSVCENYYQQMHLSKPPRSDSLKEGGQKYPHHRRPPYVPCHSLLPLLAAGNFPLRKGIPGSSVPSWTWSISPAGSVPDPLPGLLLLREPWPCVLRLSTRPLARKWATALYCACSPHHFCLHSNTGEPAWSLPGAMAVLRSLLID